MLSPHLVSLCSHRISGLFFSANIPENCSLIDPSFMSSFFWIFLVLIVGALLPVQAGLNTRLGQATGNAVYAALISFSVGGIALLVYIIVTRQQGAWKDYSESR